MDPRNSTFSPYDLLGYFIPGFLFLAFTYINLHLVDPSIQNQFFMNFSQIDTEWIILFLGLISYITGHTLSYISSFSIEDMVNSLIGYPSEYLYKKKRTLKEFRKGLHTPQTFLYLISAPFLFVYLFLYIGFREKIQKDSERGVFKKLSDETLKLIANKENALSHYLGGDGSNSKKGDFYWIISNYTYEHSKTHQKKLDNYVALYGFSRTLCLIFSLQGTFLAYTGMHENTYEITLITLGYYLLSIVFGFSFIKFYRRYTTESLLTLLSLPIPPSSVSSHSPHPPG